MAVLSPSPGPMPGLSFGAILIVLVTSALFYFLARGFYFTFFHSLSRVPGPRLYAFSQLPYLYHTIRGDWHEKLKTFHDKYGVAVRFAPQDVSFITPEAFRKIYGHKTAGEKTFEKDKTMYKSRSGTPDIINANNEDHKRMRRLLSHAFSERALRNQEDVLKYYVDAFIGKIAEMEEQGTIFDLVRWYNYATFDLIGDLAFGKPFGCLANGGYHPWVQMIFKFVKAGPFIQGASRLGIGKLTTLLIPPHLKRSSDEHSQLSKQTAMLRLESRNTDREDFMSYILRHNDKSGMSVPEIVQNSSVLIIAGSETTATLLSGTTFQLLTNRKIYDKLVAEIRSSFESEDEINLDRVNQLQYLLAVLSEGFRMYPPVPSGLPRTSPPGGEFVEGFWIPENTSVSAPHWSAFQSKENFRDPEKFIPERWLNDPKYADDKRDVLQPFSLGPRNCIGKNLAYAEMRLILVRLLWSFDIEMMPESQHWEQQKVFILWEKGDLKVKVKKANRL